MINNTLYRQQLDRIKGAFGYEIYPGSISVWKEELEKAKVTDADLIKGVDRGLSSLDRWERKPTIGDLLDKCLFERRERILQDDSRRKAQEQREARQRGGNPLTDILEKGESHKSPKVRAWIALTYQLLNGEIDKQEFDKRHEQTKGGVI